MIEISYDGFIPKNHPLTLLKKESFIRIKNIKNKGISWTL